MSRRIVIKTHLCAPGKFARSFTAKEWAALPLRGFQEIGDQRLELRNCPCGSTLAIELRPANDMTQPTENRR